MGQLNLEEDFDEECTELVFFVNGKKVVEPTPDPAWTLLYYLRKKLKLYGTKLGCAEGGCGACTVMVSRYNRAENRVVHLAVNACLAPVCAMHGLSVTTIEGIGSTRTKLHPVQERLAKAHGSQCGFCTPGIVMSMYALLRSNSRFTYSEMEVAFQGNLCRCTGYRAIIEGYKTFIEDWESQRITNGNGKCPMGQDCCKVNKNNTTNNDSTDIINGTSQGVNGDSEDRHVNGQSTAKCVNGDDKQEHIENINGESSDCSEKGIDIHLNGDNKELTITHVNGDTTSTRNGENIVEKICESTATQVNGKDKCEHTHVESKTTNESQYIFNRSSFQPYDESQEPIFPPELKMSPKYDMQRIVFRGPHMIWYRPKTLTEILELKERSPDAKIIVGNTEVGVELKFRHLIYPTLIMPNLVPDMNSITETETGIKVGASVTLMDMEHAFKRFTQLLPKYKTRSLVAIVKMLNYFAGKQIRNVAAVGGNIMTGSPISDLNPILMSLKVKLNLCSQNEGPRTVLMDENFFIGYRRNIVKPNELLISIEVPFTNRFQYIKAYKQAKRREDDISIVTASVNVEFEDNTNIIKNINIGYGGMAPVTTLAVKVGKTLKGNQWNEEMLEKAFSTLIEELPLSPSAPGGTIQFRRSLTMSLFLKAYLAIAKEMNQDYYPEPLIKPREASGAEQFHGGVPKSAQYFDLIDSKQCKSDAVGRPIVHMSALRQATGEAVYCDDMPTVEGELYLALVLSTKAHANLLSIDPSKALAMPGVEAFYCAKDLTEDQNMVGPIFHDEEVFVRKKVTSQGQILGAIVAVDQVTAQAAARNVKVEYEELQPIIVTIEDAIKHNSYHFPGPKYIKRGNVQEVFENKDNIIIEGQCRMGGQEHFYLETHCSFVVPRKEEDEIEIFCSSQHPSEIAKLVSHVLHVPMNRIVARVKRMGGGFGGKESRGMLVALPAAIAAHRLNRPVRCMLDRDEDMIMTGTRHPFLSKYKVAITKEGKILAAVVNIYNNAGHSIDLSGAIIERAIFHYENSYFIPNAEVYGHVCKTNMPSNTAFRGFGGPQGMFIGENIIRHIGEVVGKPSEEIAELNMYKENQFTHYEQELLNCTLEKCWRECIDKSEFYKRKAEIAEFNRQNRWKKRGISLVPTKFGISFTVKLLNQAGALVHIYVDGSILLSHGGTEMGQGLHTKMMQVASRVLGVDISKIHVTETSTDKVPNTSATAASAGSDLNGMAVLNACSTLVERLRPFKEKNPKGKWEDWVMAAYVERVSLSATGFYATPNVGYDFVTHEGTPFNYFTYATACTEVEIDCLSGDHLVRRTDIVMDLGQSLNPAIDIGQIEGGYIQGYGLFTMEELIFSPTGMQFSRGPGAYKIPGFADIPLEFNVSLLKGVSNPRAVFSSKAVGEPPLFLASAAFFAIKEAIKAARVDAGVEPVFKFDSPATSARIRMACEDHITAKLDVPEPGTFVPWNIVP